MMRLKIICLVCFVCLFQACNSQSKQGVNSARSDAPSFVPVVVPAMITDPQEQMVYLVNHFWDNYNFADTTLIRLPDITEQALSNYIDLMNYVPANVQQPALAGMLKQAEADAVVYQYFTGQYEKYLYDPNSPFYNEALFSFVLEAMLESASLDDLQKYRPAYLLELISKNKVGEQATDFFYTDSKNKQNPLAAITADYTLLFFYNPDCDVCQNYKQSMQQSALLNNLLDSGKLAILAIYTDDDTEAWRAYATELPANWINGYDQQQIIKNDELYDLKAIPTLYLLDKEKKVILKDANLNQIDSFFKEQQK